LPLRGS